MNRRERRRARRAQGGVSLIELVVALMLGLLLIAGVVLLAAQGRRYLRAAAPGEDAVARAAEILGRELELAGNYGLTNRGELIRGATRPHAAASAIDGRIANSCGPNFAVDLAAYVAARPPGPWALDCRATAPAAASDVLIVRHAGALVPGAGSGLIRVRSNRLGGALLAPDADDGSLPGEETRALEVEVFYVGAPPPVGGGSARFALRRLRLVAGPGGRPRMQDEELVPGIGSLRVEFGVDLDGDDSADLYAPPGAAELAAGRVVSAKLTLGAANGPAGDALVRVVALRNATVH